MKPLDQIKHCIENQYNFVLQGGAGSGKTETLKQSLTFISDQYPNKKVACITHTNLAADEILSRVGEGYSISTIHSFLNLLIKDYKKNIHQVIYEIFKLKTVQRKSLDDFQDDKALKKAEHENYKNLYGKYAKNLFTLKGESVEKVIGKPGYEKNTDEYNAKLNNKIDELNLVILEEIGKKDYNQIVYNETRFDSLKDLTYGHDGLLHIASLLFKRYPLIARILQDKFDYVFIDEFQDTHPDIVDIFLNKLPHNCKTTIGLFGDSMQGIYEDGIGDVNSYIENKQLYKIIKRDNYRCSEQVVRFLNHHRVAIDGLEQEVAFKIINSQSESITERQGSVEIYYAIFPKARPNTRSGADEKQEYSEMLINLIGHVESENNGFKKLMLTNKAISEKLGFATLFGVFKDRYSEVNTEIENCFEKLQLLELAELCIAYKEAKYNLVITELKNSGFKLSTIEDKKRIKELFDELFDDGLSAFDAIKIAIEKKLVACSESYTWYLKNKDSFLHDLNLDAEFKSFKPKYLTDGGTFAKFEKAHPDFFGSEEEYSGRESRYNTLERLFKKQRFYDDLFSNKIPFKEVIKFCHYLDEGTDYITMHKTKGSGIGNVLVVLDDFFWSKYQFKTLFESPCSKAEMKLKIQKLFYVACSRAKNNLICVRLITSDEEDSFTQYFSKEVSVKEIKLSRQGQG